MPSDDEWMRRALELAERAFAQGEVPVGAVLVREGALIGEGHNQPIAATDPTAHAEMMALRDAARREGNYRLPGSTLFVTIEPCTMCAGALIHARVARLVYGAPEPRQGAVVSTARVLEVEGRTHRVDVTGGVLADDCGALLIRFFRERRDGSGGGSV